MQAERGTQNRAALGQQSKRAGCSLALLLTVLSGCGQRGLKPVAVRGQITYDGGQWPKPGCLYFTSQPANGVTTRPGIAGFGTDGRFQVTTSRPGDGLLPGEYQVSVECWEADSTMNPADLPRSFVPEMYQSGATSGLHLTVPADSSQPIEVQFDVPHRAS